MCARPITALRCDACDDVIGVYEPATVLVRDAFAHTSVAADPVLVESAERRYHRSCAPGAAGRTDDTTPPSGDR